MDLRCHNRFHKEPPSRIRKMDRRFHNRSRKEQPSRNRKTDPRLPCRNRPCRNQCFDSQACDRANQQSWCCTKSHPRPSSLQIRLISSSHISLNDEPECQVGLASSEICEDRFRRTKSPPKSPFSRFGLRRRTQFQLPTSLSQPLTLVRMSRGLRLPSSLRGSLAYTFHSYATHLKIAGIRLSLHF